MLLLYSSSQRRFLLHEGLYAIDHVLDKLFLGFAKSSLIRNVEYAVVGFRVLSVNTSNLDFVLVRNLVERFLISHQLWQLDMHRCSHGCSEVRWA